MPNGDIITTRFEVDMSFIPSDNEVAYHYYCDPGEVRSIVMSMSVCPLAYLENHVTELHQISVRVACGRGSVLFWRRCDMLYTSGFVDDALFSHDHPMARNV